jgi:hypothetical protein
LSSFKVEEEKLCCCFYQLQSNVANTCKQLIGRRRSANFSTFFFFSTLAPNPANTYEKNNNNCNTRVVVLSLIPHFGSSSPLLILRWTTTSPVLSAGKNGRG